MEAAVELLGTMERNTGLYSTRRLGRLADAADELRREFTDLRENGMRMTLTHRERDRSRSQAAAREAWAKRVQGKLDKLRDVMHETHSLGDIRRLF